MKTPIFFIITLLLLIPKINFGQAPDLGVSSSFAVFTAVGAFTNDGLTVVNGDIGTDAGLFTGFPPGIVVGSIHVADPVADQAAIDVDDAYSDLASLSCGMVIGTTLGSGQTLLPNIYCLGAASTINGTLELDGGGDPDAIFVFQIDGALSTGTLANVVLINGASLCNVFWQVNGAFTLGEGSVFRGTLINNGAIHLLEASSLFGRALSRAGAIDLHNNVISVGFPPVAAVITPNGPTTFCAGGSVTLSGNVDGTWSTGSGAASINVTTSGDYYVVNTTLCGSDTSNHIIVVVIPDTPPIITCPADLTLECDQSTATTVTGTATATDICGTAPTVTFTDAVTAGLCLQSFSISRVWTATDATGNTSTCEQIISVSDNFAPAISCPPNITIQCNTNTSPATTGSATALDNCDATPVITFTDEVAPSQVCLQAYTILRTWRATDACGNNNFCSQLIVVVDTTPPVISCPANVTLPCGGNTLPASTGSASGADNCDPNPITDYTDVLIPAAGCPSVIRTWTLTDDCGNASSCTQIITVTNGTTISITCPGALSVQCASLVPTADVTQVVTSSTCPGIITVTLTGEVVTGQTCANRYTTTRTYTAVDACGNVATCTQAITVFDNTAPTLTCPVNLTVQCASDVPVANVTGIVTADNCGGTATVSFLSDVITPGTCPNRFSIARTYRSTDACGNFTDCTQTISVFDNTTPTLTCPGNITVQCALDVPVPNPTGIVTADNCGGTATVSFISEQVTPGVCANRFTVTRTYRSTDACGNFTDCTQTISVLDNTPPSITCPGNITVQCAVGVPVPNPTGIITADNCGGTATVSFLADIVTPGVCANRFTVTRTYRSTDACGNFTDCNQTISVLDNTPPSITCPGNITVQCAVGVPIPNPTGIVTADNCGGTATVAFLADLVTPGVCANRFTVTRTYRSTDACGNFTDCTQTISVLDNTPPSITCPGNITVQCATQVPAVNPNGIVTADNCGGTASVVFVSDVVSNFICANQFIVTRTYSATDACGNNALCTQIITVFDNSALSIVCPANVTVQCAADVPAINLNLSVISNACGGTTTVSLLSNVLSNQTCANRYTLTRTYLATDACAQSSTCSQTITVLDNTPPTFILPNGWVNGGTFDVQCFGQDPNWDLPEYNATSVNASDNCTGNVNVTFRRDLIGQGSCPDDGYINRYRLTWTATDDCGNSSSAHVFMALIDTIAPVIHSVPADITVNCNLVPEPPTVVFATDECLCACVLLVSETLPTSGCLDGQVMLRTWTAKDRCGNITTATQRITLINNTPPSLQLLQTEMSGITGDTLIEYTCSEGGIPQFYNFLNGASVTGASSCGSVVNVTFDQKTIIARNCDFSGYAEQRTFYWHIVDQCGNVADLNVIVRLIDNTAPVLTDVPALACIGDPSLKEIEAFDECGEGHVRFWDVTIPNPCGSGTAFRRTYEAYDNCGNMSRDTVILIPNDQTNPSLEFVNPMLDSLGFGEIFVLNCAAHDQQVTPFGTLDVASVDACSGPVKLSFTETLMETGDCSIGGNVALMQLLWTATDVCGNLSTLTAIASVEDKTSPVFVDLVPIVSIGCNDSLPEYAATDNCGSVTITVSDRYFYGDCLSRYDVEREVTATDPCGNETVFLQIVHVGGGGPTINGVKKEICNDLTLPVVTAFDECAGVFVQVQMVQDTLENECQGLVIRRTWSAVNTCGDSSHLEQIIVMGDTIPPVILIPSYSVVQLFIDGLQNVINFSETDLMKKLNALNANSLSVSDACQEIDLVFNLTVTSLDCSVTGYSERRIYTWTATDACGNTASKFIIIDIIDDVPPVITGVPNDTMIVCQPLPVVPVLISSDFSLPLGVVFTESTSSDDGTGISIVTRTWTFTDACGNKTVREQKITWVPNSYLVCNINVPEVVDCNSHGVIITSDVTGGFGPYTYEWTVVGNKCFIQGGQGTPDIEIYMGWSDVKIILIVTDAFGCESMCMTVLHCLEPGEIPFTDNSAFEVPAAQPENLHVNGLPSFNTGEEESLKELNVWPNPTNSSFNISFESLNEEEVVFSFTDFLGQVILKDRIKVLKGLNTKRINVDQLPGGSYLLELKSAKKVYSKVVIILPRD